MKKMIQDYIRETEAKIKSKRFDPKKMERDLLRHIEFFQHERLIHLLVTMLVSLIVSILLVASLFIDNMVLMIILFIFVLLLIPYMFHYYFLENSVQYLYSLYNEVLEKLNR